MLNLMFVMDDTCSFFFRMREKAKFLLYLSSITYLHQMIRLICSTIILSKTTIKGVPNHYE